MVRFSEFLFSNDILWAGLQVVWYDGGCTEVKLEKYSQQNLGVRKVQETNSFGLGNQTTESVHVSAAVLRNEGIRMCLSEKDISISLCHTLCRKHAGPVRICTLQPASNNAQETIQMHPWSLLFQRLSYGFGYTNGVLVFFVLNFRFESHIVKTKLPSNQAATHIALTSHGSGRGTEEESRLSMLKGHKLPLVFYDVIICGYMETNLIELPPSPSQDFDVSTAYPYCCWFLKRMKYISR